MRKAPLSGATFTAIAAIQTLVIVGGLALLGSRVHASVRALYLQSLAARLSDTLTLLSRTESNRDPRGWCARAAQGTQIRMTLIEVPSLMILCDNYIEPAAMPLKATGPEVAAALVSPERRGQAVRWSRGLHSGEGLLEALYLPERKQVLRVGLTAESVGDQLASLRRTFTVAIGLLSLALAAVLYWTTRRILFRRASAAVQASEENLQQTLVANVSHEFRTPLTSIRGFADAIDRDLRAGKSPDPQFAPIIKKETDRLLGMVTDLLDLAVLESGHVPLAQSDIPVLEATQEALQALQMAYGEKQHTLTTHAEAATVYADPHRLHQILLNVIGNAMKYSPARSPIEISWAPYTGGVELRVKDAGPGISAYLAPELFTRFRRDARAATSGTGLGLAIARGWVEAHGGSLGFESIPGQGATFWARFPS